MNLIEEFLYLQEVNRIVQGLSKNTGKPKEHIDKIWKDTEKEVLVKHKYGVTDRYKQIGKIVKSKLGIQKDADEPGSFDDDAKDDKAKKAKEVKDNEGA